MYKVIIADDEPLILQKMKQLFHWEDYGFELVASTTSSEELLELIKKELPQVVLLDINMPVLTGLDVIGLLKKEEIKCKFVIVSGYADFKYAQEAISHGVFEYLLKPVSRAKADQLLEQLKDVLDEEYGIAKNIEIDSGSNLAFQKLIHYIDMHFCEKLYLNELAQKFDINMTYCCYLFKKSFSCGFTQYVLKLRMEFAATLILENELSTSQIAEKCGYDYYHFNKIFKKYFGLTPRQYKASKM